MVHAFLIIEQLQLDPYKVISTILHYHFKELWEHTDLKLDEFYELYKKSHALATSPFPLDNLTINTDSKTDPMTQEEVNNNATTNAHTVCLPEKSIIIGVFTRSAYFARIEEIKIDISLKKLLTTNRLE